MDAIALKEKCMVCKDRQERHRLASQKNRNMVRQNNHDLQDKLLESETKVANLTYKLGTATKCIEERDKTIVLRDAKKKVAD